MLIPILSFHHIVETFFGFPGGFVLLFGLLSDFVLIDNWESQAEMFCGVSVEFCGIARNLKAHLFLLELPNVELLARVLEYIDFLRNIETLFKWPVGLHRPNISPVHDLEVLGNLSSSLFH